jgi:tetratricopeptide (TPR) repeat protein
MELGPNDLEPRCGVAMARLAIEGDSGLLKTLYRESAPHRSLGDVYLSNQDYEKAAREYAQAIGIDRGDTDALNGYAYTIYRWHLDASMGHVKSFPTVLMYQDASDHAATTVRLTENQRTRIDHQIMQSTLGEMDLACGDPKHAAGVLRAILDGGAKTSGIEHPRFDEIRWDLAQADVCLEPFGDPEKKDAEQRLGVLISEERDREDQRFVGPPDDGFVDRNLDNLKKNCVYFATTLEQREFAEKQKQSKQQVSSTGR